jgi:mannose/fructose/N-acetylgalactosamine-specific phosphotransferase system component IIC
MMETYSFLTFMGGILVGMGIAMLMVVLAMVMWSRRDYRD